LHNVLLKKRSACSTGDHHMNRLVLFIATDACRAHLDGCDGALIAVLHSLQRIHESHTLPGSLAAFGISGGMGEALARLFMSHPPLEARIAAVQHL
jgi:heat shock protein HtpX